MKELFRVNKHLVSGKHDLWIVMKSCFAKNNSMEVEEVEGLFIQALKKMDRFDGHKGKQHR
jgi:hypothetical protein